MRTAQIKVLEQELDWLEKVIQARMQLYFGQEMDYKNIYDITPPNIEKSDATYARILRHYDFNAQERLILILALAPHLAPYILDVFFMLDKAYNRPYTEFGGRESKQHRGFLPTIETAIFLLAGSNFPDRMQAKTYFDKDHAFFQHRLLHIDHKVANEPFSAVSLQLSEEFLAYFTTGESYEPTFSSTFPAKKITTKLQWSDLILSSQMKAEIQEIGTWIQNQKVILQKWGYEKHLKPGYRSLFFGPPGTGKSLTAVLLGEMVCMDVYRIDLSQVVSKYIGETEKNLATVFDIASQKNWILFFDEADALFGKRTATKDSKDRYANQETAYLLQRIEDFPGIIILASNLKMNIDPAFSRRFQSMIHFPMPDAEQRLQLWKNIFDGENILHPSVDLKSIAMRYELSGGAIINVLRYCTLLAVVRKPPLVMQDDILLGIRKELVKEGKVV